MQDLPHRYSVSALAAPGGDAFLEAKRLPRLASAPPTEFGGPGNRWSPETLLAAAVADCFVLTFRAIANATPLPWVDIRCDVEGTLDRVGPARGSPTCCCAHTFVYRKTRAQTKHSAC